MSPGASTRRARKHSQSSAKRSEARRTAAASKRRSRGQRRKFVVIGLVLIVGLAVGYGIANRDELTETLRSVTLPLRHEDVIVEESDQHDVPPDLVAAVIFTESKFRDQTSEAGARGLMQITPPTAVIIEQLSGGTNFKLEDLSDPDVNIAYGTFYLRHLLDKFDGNETAALAAYNAGETHVAAWGGSDLEVEDIQFPETRDYVEKVLDKRTEYREHYRDQLALD